MPLRAITLACLYFVLCGRASALSFPEQLQPAVGAGDVSVQMTVDEDGSVVNATIVESKRPASNDEVLKALRGWLFRPALEGDKEVRKSSVRSFVFSEAPVPEVQQKLLASLGARSLVPGEPLPEDKKGPRQFFIEGNEGPPSDLFNVIWLSSWGVSSPEVEAGLQLELLIDASGGVVAARSVGVASDAATKSVLRGFFRLTQFEPLRLQEGVSLARTRVPIRFYEAPDFGKLEPKFPKEMSGLGGILEWGMNVGADGRISDLQLLKSSHPSFELSMVEQLAGARIQPAIRLGKPVAMRIYFRFVFLSELPDGTSVNSAYRTGTGQPSSDKLPKELRYDVAPEVTFAVAPVYPFELIRKGVEGYAEAVVMVDPEGYVSRVSVTKASMPEFGESFKASVQGWRFSPAMKEGKPTWAAVSIARQFSPNLYDMSEPAERILRQLKEKSTLPSPDQPLVPRYQPQPEYPLDKLDQVNAQAMPSVTVEFFVDRKGQAQFPRAIEFTDEAFAWAAVTAVARWHFDPPMHNGEPADVVTRMKIAFAP